MPGFETSLRERVAAMAPFQHPAFARVHAVGRVAKAQSRLVVASDRVAGVRLADVLAGAEQRLIPLVFDAALALLQQLLRAVSALHEAQGGLSHGALAPERILITPDARLVVVEHVFAPALEQLRYSRERYWTDLRVALPPSVGLARLDRRADVTQIGAVALALTLGRPLGDDEYPARVPEILDGVRAISEDGLDDLSGSMKTWLSRTLQLDPRNAFATAVEAAAAFESASGIEESASHEALVAFLAQYNRAFGVAAEPPREAPAEPVAAPATAATPPDATPVAPSAAAAEAVPVARIEAPVALPEPPRSFAHEEADEEPVPVGRQWRGRLAAAAAILIALTTAGVFAARSYVRAPATGTLIVNTNPSGVTVSIDGQSRGSTPLTVELAPGEHTLELAADGQTRTVPVTIAEGAQVAQFIELPKAAPVEGQLHVRTEPPGAVVTVDGERRGQSPLVVGGLTPGAHTVVLENDLGSVTEQVTIEPGATASLVVPLAAPRGAPVSGWIAVAAPVEMQVFEDGRLLGSTRTERIMVPVGRHQLEIVNDALGYRATRVIQVTPGRVSAVKVDLPRGSMALNATPWAEVWVDGERVGETPIGNVQLPIGTHDVLFRHPELGEQRHTAVVTLSGPARISADMRKKP